MRAKVELFVDLDRVAADADGALDPNAQASLYDSLDWFRLTREHIVRDAPLLIARARGRSGTAWLFLVGRPGRSAEPLGSWYTLRFAPVYTGATDATGRVALLREIARALKPRVGRLAIEPVTQADAAELIEGFSAAGWFTHQSEKTANWVAHVPAGGFEAYWDARPGQLKSTVRRKAPKAKLEVRILDAFDADAWASLEAVFAASWKGEEGSPPFLRALAQRTAAWGRMRLGLAFNADGVPLAAQFWTIDGSVATIHKLAYVDAAKALSPGSILSHAMFRHVIERDRPALIDFGTGDDPYKADWMDERRMLHRVEVFNPTSLAGLIAYGRHRASGLVARRRSA